MDDCVTERTQNYPLIYLLFTVYAGRAPEPKPVPLVVTHQPSNSSIVPSAQGSLSQVETNQLEAAISRK